MDFPEHLRASCLASQPCTSTAAPRTPNQIHAPGRRTQFFHWNASGMSASKLDEIKLWALQQAIDVLTICETHWSFTQEWQDDHWNFLHCGSSDDKSNGILILVRKTFCDAMNIQWHSVLTGRILHLRLHGASRPIDLIARYQYMDDHSGKRLLLRKRFWKSLQEYLPLLPKRNTFIMLGDFNCGLYAMNHLVGSEFFRWEGKLHAGHRHAETGEEMQILRDYNLITLNTWNAKLGPTYMHGRQATRIDFVISKVGSVDSTAKYVKYLHDVPFLGSPGFGHVPILCSLPYSRIPPKGLKSLGFSFQDRQQCRAAWKLADFRWTSLVKHASHIVEQYSHEATQEATGQLQGLHDMIAPCLRRTIMNIQDAPKPKTVDPVQIQILSNKWDHLRHARATVRSDPRSLRHWFRCWIHLARFHAMDRSHRKFATQLRKQKMEEIICSARVAAMNHDSFRLHQIIRQFSPKAPQRRIQIRNRQGAIAHPHEEFAIMSSFIQKTWSCPFHFDPWSDLAPPGVPFSEADLKHALEHIPPMKAVAKPFVMGLLIRQLAGPLSQYVYKLLQQWWSFSPPILPQEWKDGWLCFMAKPNKVPDRPQHLRALALQEPIGKCITGLITKVALRQVFATLCSWPQYACLPWRSTQDAIARVSRHCAFVRSLVLAQRKTVISRASNSVMHACCGGVQIFLDLSKAFDCVDRLTLFKCLPECGITPDIYSLIIAFHMGTQYHFLHDGHYHAIEVHRGVRQGCKIAPLLWACFMHHFLKLLSRKVGIDWVRQHVTLYADDLHVGVAFYSKQELDQHLKHFGIVIDLLAELGLQVNVDKSQILFAVAGTNSQKLQKETVIHRRDGSWINLPRQNGATAFKVDSVATYLGVKMNYRNMESQTLQCRLQAGNHAACRLHRWLTSRQIDCKHRLRLWNSCVLPVLTYGLFTTGITYTGLHKLQSMMFQSLRNTLRDYAYLTRHTHQEALAQHQCPEPLQILLQAVRALRRSVTQRLPLLPEHDIVHSTNWSPLEQAERLIWTGSYFGESIGGTLHQANVPLSTLHISDRQHGQLA